MSLETSMVVNDTNHNTARVNNDPKLITNYNNTNTTRVSPGGTTGSQACAACKYQRRKCSSDCPLAPYFPPEDQARFLNAHKLFGVSNIKKVLANLTPLEKDIAMKSMFFQANVRANDPVGGCYRIISQLQRQIDYHKAELDLVLHQLAICRAQAQVAQHEFMPNPITMKENSNINVDASSAYDPILGLEAIEYGRPLCVLSDRQLQRGRCIGYDNYDAPGFDASVSFKQPLVNDTEDVKSHLGLFEQRPQVLFESKESIQSSDKDVEKDDVGSIQAEQKNDLKGAASQFSLTN